MHTNTPAAALMVGFAHRRDPRLREGDAAALEVALVGAARGEGAFELRRATLPMRASSFLEGRSPVAA